MVFKSRVRAALCAGVTMLCLFSMAGDALAQAEPRYDVLVFSRTTGFRHTAAINAGRTALQQMGTTANFSTTLSEDAGAFTSHNLRNFDVVVFLNTDGEGILNATQRTAFERWMQRGGGAVSIHADANADKAWQWKRELMGGGLFDNHPPIQQATVQVADADHPATDELPATFQWTDEWYNFEADPREQVHVLLTVDESTYTGGEHGAGHPIAWCSNFDGGRHFYTGLGHADGGATPAWSDQRYLGHVLGALDWVAGEAGTAADCGPERAAPPTAASLRKVTLDDETANPMGLSIADDGRVFYAQMGSTQSTSGPAQVKVYDPEADETFVVGTLQVFRRNEIGLMGIALDPDFETNNFIYLYYGRPGGTNTDMGANRLSRFTFNPAAGEAGQLDMSSEVVLLEVPSQRLVCCHEAGSIQFGPDGLLYLSTGDNTEHARSNGYAPIDSRECGPGSWNAGDADCNANPASWPADARHANDARRSSGNTNDLRGKIIRINPLDSAEPGDPMGPGSTYSVPAGNLFPAGTPLTRPEIYTMGHRNPFRFGFDPETGWIYQGEVGPDSNQDNLQAPGHPISGNTGRGPRGYDEINQIRSAGNMGWPFCIANSKAYRPWTYTGTGNSGAGVPNPDANVPYYDCANGPTNDSPVNTGQSQLPPARDAWIYYPYGSSPEFPDIPAAGSRAAIGGPVYRFDPELDSDVKLSEWFDGRLIWADWTRNIMLTTKIGPNGEYQGTTELLPEENFLHTHDIELGPDGALYVLEWGNNFNYGSYGVNADSGLYRIEQVQPGDQAPVATISADRLTGPAPLEVQFTGELSDQGGAEAPTYEWNFGDGSPTSNAVNPTHTFAEPGAYDVTLTVSDGEVTDSATVRITVLEPGQCLPQKSDEFDGTDLDPTRWEVVRRDADLTVSGGAAHILSANADIVGGGGNMPNIVLQEMPPTNAPWTYTVRMTWNPTTNFQNAGLIVYADDDNYLKTGMVWSGSRQFEVAKETGGGFGVVGSSGNVGAAFPQTFYVRLVSTTGQNVQAQYAPDVGGQPGTFVNTTSATDLSGITNPRIGIYATSSTQAAAGRIPADFHSVTVEPDALPCDEDDPVTTAQLNGAAPVETYDGPVEVTLSATDGDDETASGVDYTEYRIDGGDWVRSSNAGGDDPFVTEFSVTAPGEHVIEYRSADGAANVEAVKTVAFEIEGGSGCLPQRSDEFEGTGLNRDLWSVVREDVTRLTVAGGAVNIVSAPQDIHGGDAGLPNIVLQDMPDTSGPWSFTARYTWNPTQNYQNAGLLIYVDDANWIKSGMVWSGGRRFEAFKELNDTPTGLGSATEVLPESFPQTFYVRFSSTTGQNVQAQYSPDGQTWTNTGTATDLTGLANAKIGFYATASTQSGVTQPTASFEAITVTPDEAECEDQDPPVTTAELNGAAPQQTYNGPVQVALSATDPAGGDPPEPQEHLVEASGFAWDPAQVNAVVGDTVTWDMTEGFHDICLDDTVPTTGPPPTGRCASDDEEIASEFEGEQEGSKTFTAAGTYDFYCSVHWPTMKGTVTVAPASGGGEASGVDYTEYRVDGGDWVRRENTGGEDPFETAFSVAEEGDHTVDYRSADEAGNVEAMKSVSFRIQQSEPGTPVVRGFADPASGAAPLFTRFSATGFDPDGGPLSYKWVVEGVGTVLDSHFEHRFREAGVYTATVTVTDNEGDTASDTIEVTVGGAANQAPTVDASATPTSGAAPLTVAFGATGNDPDGPENVLEYMWEFGDGGMSFEKSPSHEYLAPGTYTARVTVRDAGGATGTDTVQITVGDGQGNRAPEITDTGLLGAGPAPLTVTLSAEASDPDGDELTYSWSYGDGTAAGSGRVVSHTYQTAGSYTATVTVSDGNGGTDTADVEVVVGNPGGNQAPTVQAAADPGSGSAPLNVRFSSAARDPDGDPLLYVWTFGDGGSAGGAAVTHTYAAPGTYTATITVTDSRGATGTDTVEVTVSAAQAQVNQQSLGDTAAPAPATDEWFGVNRTGRTSVARFVRRGLKVSVTCNDAMSGTAALKVDRRTSRRLGLRSTTLARRSVRCAEPGTTSVTLKPSRAVARRLASAKRVRATLSVTVEGTRTVQQRVTIGARR